jgi:hypothetical protein
MARILTYGYPAQQVYLRANEPCTGTSRILPFAEALCAALRARRIEVSRSQMRHPASNR